LRCRCEVDPFQSSSVRPGTRLGPDRWERAYAAGRVTSIESLIKDIDRSVGNG
jgi:hypothetical protein